MTDGTPGRASGGLRGALGNLGASLVALLRTRLELASIELEEERSRAIASLVLVHVIVLAFAFALLAASALVVVWFWDSYRIGALCALTIAYLAIGCIALWRFRQPRPTDDKPFAGTLAELERDRAWLADEMRSEK